MAPERRPGDWAAWMATSASASTASPGSAETRERAGAGGPSAGHGAADAAQVADAHADGDATADAPRTARREATRQRVLDAAREVFAEKGVIGGTVEDICERAGFTRGAFYSNFGDKDDVVVALIEREQASLLEHIDLSVAALDPELSGAEDLAEIAGSIIGRVLRSIPVDRQVTLIQTELEIFAIRRPDLARAFIESNARFREGVAAFIEGALRRYGRELLVDRAILADAVFSIAQGSVRRALLAGPHADVDAMSREVLPGLLLTLTRQVDPA
jgi:AcrR family transcriptional regulator